MKKYLMLVLCQLSTFYLSLHGQKKIYEFSGGQWFNGQEFIRKNFYSVNGYLTEKKPPFVDSVILLNNRYVVPPFGDAHHHGIDGKKDLARKIDQFLRDGIFYVKNPNVIPSLLGDVYGEINHPSSIDVSFSNGGLTAPGGHPVPLYRWLISQGTFGDITEKDLEGMAYFIIDNEKDLGEKWEAIIARKPDFIKLFLLNSDEYEKRKNDPEYEGQRGLNPALLPLIVKKAQSQNLEVSCHVENAEDFSLAAAAAVNEINHIPLPHSLKQEDIRKATITDTAAKLAFENKVRVVGTLCWTLFSGIKDSLILKKLHALNKKNVQILNDHGVILAIGSDGISGEEPMRTGLTEASYWHKEGFLDNLALLKAWTENTALTIFPNRKIGYLREGYEANLLVLDGNPLEDFENVKNINLRFKQGHIINLHSK